MTTPHVVPGPPVDEPVGRSPRRHRGVVGAVTLALVMMTTTLVAETGTTGAAAAPSRLVAGTGTCTRDFADDLRFVAHGYVMVLGRAADGEDAVFWARRFDLPTAASLQGFARSLTDSAEYRGRAVRRSYQQTLGRAPDEAGGRYWTEWMRKGAILGLDARLLASNEHYRAVGARDRAWIDDLYQHAFGRSTDAAGLTYWVTQLHNGAVTRDHVALAVFRSPEGLARQIDTLFMRTLGRSADTGGISYWGARLVANGDGRVVAQLVDSNEFWRAAQTAYGAPATDKPADCRRLTLAGRTIAIDPGHNGGNRANSSKIAKLVSSGNGSALIACDQTGAQTGNGYAEHALAWDVSKRLRTLLESKGARVVMTRPNDTGYGPCVPDRAAIGNNARADLAISIHADGNDNASNRGFHILVPGTLPNGRNNAIIPRSRDFGTLLRDVYRDRTRMPVSNYIPNGIQGRTDLGGLNLSTVPKVFIETGAMTNRNDAALLESASFRQEAASAIAAAMEQWLQ